MSKAKKLSADDMKKAAALAVLPKILNGMKIGLGTGSTANHFIKGLADKVKAEKLDVTCIPTSRATAELATSLGLKLATLEDHPYLDMVVDGADEIDPQFQLIKGGGGALLIEKIVASSSRYMVVIADASKQVKTLGAFPLPVEVVPVGIKATGMKMDRLFKALGMNPKMTLRTRDGKVFQTDAGNCIIDCACGAIKEADKLDHLLNNIPGVVNNGLFVGICGIAYIAHADGRVEELLRT